MNRETFLLALLLVVWWVGLWGFLDTLLQMVHKGNPMTSLVVYGSLIVFVSVVLFLRPSYIEYFI